MKYTISELAMNIYSLIRTKLFYPSARLIRFPFYVRYKKSINFGRGLTTGYSCRIDAEPGSRCLNFGNNVRLGDRVHIVASENVYIGDDCLFASNIFVSDTEHGKYDISSKDILTIPCDRELITSPVRIGKRCWVGENVCILKGSSIGDNCIIGAGSVVKGSIPDYCIAVGQPARVIKRYNVEESKWESSGR